MGLAVVTVASGGLPVVDVTGIAPRTGMPVTEAANGYGVPVTKVVALGMPVVFETIGVAAPIVGATFNGTPTGAVAVTNGGLTATHGSTANSVGVASASFRSSGKYYFEITLQVATNTSNKTGIIVSTGIISDIGTAGNNGAVLSFGASTTILSNGVDAGKNFGAQAVGDVYGAAVNLDARLIWFRKNGGNWNTDAAANPATGINGVSIMAGLLAPVAYFTGAASTAAMTGNFGQSTFVSAVPAGFTSGWPA